MTERETVTSALAGPLVNALATSAGVAPCAPIPGSRRTDCGISFLASLTARGYVAPTTAPTLERPHSPTTSWPSSATSLATCCQTWFPSDRVRSWTSVPPGFDVFTRQKTPPGAPARGDERLERIPSEIRVHRQGIRERCRPVPRLEVGGRVRARRVTDVAALRVDDDEQPGRRGVLAHLLERPHAVGAEHLEHAACGFTATTYGQTASIRPRQKRENAFAASARPSTASELERQELEPRIEAHDELAAPLRDGGREPVCERRCGAGSDTAAR